MSPETANKVIENVTTSAAKIRKLEEDNAYLRMALGLIPDATGRVTVKAILKAVAKSAGLRIADITGSCRSADLAYARQTVYALSLRENLSAAQIGRVMGRDHTTVISGARRAEKAIRAGMEASNVSA